MIHSIQARYSFGKEKKSICMHADAFFFLKQRRGLLWKLCISYQTIMIPVQLHKDYMTANSLKKLPSSRPANWTLKWSIAKTCFGTVTKNKWGIAWFVLKWSGATRSLVKREKRTLDLPSSRTSFSRSWWANSTAEKPSGSDASVLGRCPRYTI